MSHIGICEYVIGIVAGRGIAFYTGEERHKFIIDLSRAKRYADLELLRDDLQLMPVGATCKILEIQKCPKCGKEFIEHPAISRVDNETEICPECGVAEAVDAYVAHEKKMEENKNEKR